MYISGDTKKVFCENKNKNHLLVLVMLGRTYDNMEVHCVI